MTLAPKTMAVSLYRQIKALMAKGEDFDLIDGHYFYPDGVAIAEVARKLDKPFTVTARARILTLFPSMKRRDSKFRILSMPAITTLLFAKRFGRK